MLDFYPTSNRSLAKIATLTRDSWLSVTSDMLPKSMRAALTPFYELIADQPFADDVVTLLCAFDKTTQTYTRTYAPAVYCNPEGQLILVWNNQPFPLTEAIFSAFDVEVQQVKLEKYEETCLVLVNETEDGDFIEMPVQLKISKEHRDVALAEIKKIVKQIKSGKADPAALAAFLWVREQKADGERKEFAPTLSLKELPQDVVFKILAAEYKDFGTHGNYILNITDNADFTGQCYAPSIVRSSLDAGATLTDKATFKYLIKKATTPKGRDQYLVKVEGIEFPEDEEMVKI